MKRVMGFEVMRYLFASGLAFALDAGLLFLLTHYVGINYLVSAAVGFCAGLAATYLLSIYWVFDHRKIASWKVEFALFGGIGFVGLGINELGLYLLTEYAGVHYMGSKVLVSFLVFTWNYLARKYALFHRGSGDV